MNPHILIRAVESFFIQVFILLWDSIQKMVLVGKIGSVFVTLSTSFFVDKIWKWAFATNRSDRWITSSFNLVYSKVKRNSQTKILPSSTQSDPWLINNCNWNWPSFGWKQSKQQKQIGNTMQHKSIAAKFIANRISTSTSSDQ